jgi:hypothetical protein
VVLGRVPILAIELLLWHAGEQAPAVTAVALDRAVDQSEFVQPVHRFQELGVVLVLPHFSTVLSGEAHQAFSGEEVGGEIVVCGSAVPILVELFAACADRQG